MQTRRRPTRPPRATFMPQKPRMATTTATLSSSSSHAAAAAGGHAGMPAHAPAAAVERGGDVTAATTAAATASPTPNAVNNSGNGVAHHGDYAPAHTSNGSSSSSSSGYPHVNGDVATTTTTTPPLISNGTSNGGTSNNSMTDGACIVVGNGSSPASSSNITSTHPSNHNNSNNSSSESCLQRIVREAGVEQRGLPLRDLRRHIGTAEVALGIDGAHLLQRMTAAVRARDPMAAFTATMPIALYEELAAIRSEIDGLGDALIATVLPDGSTTRLGFKPVFVFDGIPLSAAVDPPFTPPPPTPEEWCNCHAHHADGAVRKVPLELRAHAASRFRCEEDVHNAVVRQLKTFYRNVFRAPYLAAAQLSAFLLPQNRYVSELYGSLTLLAYPGVERVVTRIDAEAHTFDVVYKSAVLECMNRRASWQRKFTEADLAEWILLDMMQEYMHTHLPTQKVRDVLESLLRVDAMPEHGLTSAFAARWPKELAKSLHASLVLLDAPVLMSSGACLPLHIVHHTAPHSPITVAEALGVPLPSVLYFSLFAGLVSPALVATSAQRCLVDRWPLVDSAAYREVQRVILPLRIQACCQLVSFSSHLPQPQTWYRQYAQVRRSHATTDEKMCMINCPHALPLVEWRLAGDVALNERAIVYFSDTFDYMNRLHHSVPMPGPLYHTVSETCASVLLKTLDMLGYLYHDEDKDGMPIITSTAFSYALSRFTCDTLSEYAVLMIELLRTRALTDDVIQTTIRGNHDAPAYPRGVRFACRLLSIIPLNISGAWRGPFDVEMAAFASLSRSVSRTLRSVVDALATLTFVTQRTRLSPEHLVDVIACLPFHIPVEFAAGNLMMYVLQNPQCTLTQLEQTFPECYALQSDLYTLFAFWEMAYVAMLDLMRELPLDRTLLNDAHEHVRNAAMRLGCGSVAYV